VVYRKLADKELLVLLDALGGRAFHLADCFDALLGGKWHRLRALGDSGLMEGRQRDDVEESTTESH